MEAESNNDFNNNNNNNNTNKNSPTRKNLNLNGNDRPPGRLNYYDSDTNTLSDMMPSGSNKLSRRRFKYPNDGVYTFLSIVLKWYEWKHFFFFKKIELASPSQSLSDLNETNFGQEIDADGHRTSTPNMSKKKRSSSYSSSDMHQVRSQLKNLEKMYQEILRIVDNGFDRNTLRSSSTFSLYNSESDTKKASKSQRTHSTNDHDDKKMRAKHEIT